MYDLAQLYILFNNVYLYVYVIILTCLLFVSVKTSVTSTFRIRQFKLDYRQRQFCIVKRNNLNHIFGNVQQ